MYQRLLFFITANCLCFIIAAQPVIRMQNGSMSSCEMFIVDSDSLQGNYASGVRTLTITSANNTRLAFNMEYFQRRTDGDNMAIFDGPTISSTLLTTITGTLGSGPSYAVSTGNSLTLRFSAAFNSVNPGKFRSEIRCVTDPAPLSVFQPVRNSLGSGNIQVADYDKDGDKDILLGGQVYRNDSYTDSLYLAERKPGIIDGWSTPKFVAADFDNDGDKDVFMTGFSLITGFTLIRAALYTNDGTGTFTRVTSQVFDPAYNGACSVVDFNNDGKMDICYTGATTVSTNPVLVFKLYLNNGNLSFTDVNITLPGLTGLQGATMSWGDSEGDGDLDLVINGFNGSSTYSRLLLRNGNSLVSQSAPLTNASGGRILWADVNLDGKLDIVNTGVHTPSNIDAIVPEILFNNGSNSFTRVATNLPALPSGTHDWGNFDGDNDMDVVLCGMKPDLSRDAAVYKNNGNGSFTRIEIEGVTGLTTVKWIDINQDGKLDVYITGGRDNDTYFLKNMGADVFKKASFPITGYDSGGTVLVDDFTGDGKVDLLLVGGLSDVDCYGAYGSVLVKGIGWRITGVPSFTRVADLRNSNPNGTGTLGYSPYWKWGDFDSDGYPDILLTTDLDGDVGPNPYVIIFRNAGNDNFPVAFNTYATPMSPLGSANRRQVGIFDIDNDGKNELFVTHNSVYKWINNNYVTLYTEPDNDCNIGCISHYVDFADYDKDGFMDAAVVNSGTVDILHNNRAGRLVRLGDFGHTTRQVKWVDIDNDGDPDLVSSGSIVENRNGEMVWVGNGIKTFVHTGIGDFNQDGLPDLVNITDITTGGPGDFYLNMQGTKFFKNISTGKLLDCLDQPWKESVESFDMDNDGDDDIVHTANGCCTPSVLFANMYNITHRNIHVMTPNGGETFASGTVKTIQWIGTQIGSDIKIELSRDSLQTWETISAVASSTATGGSFQWNVTGPSSTKCFVRVTDNSNNSIRDVSNSSFTITTTTGVNNLQTSIPLKVYPNPQGRVCIYRTIAIQT